MTIAEARPPGRPRSQPARQAILAAAMEIASERGPERLTMEGIADRAGVSKETLYRWWRSRTGVLLEALSEYGEQAVPVPATGSLDADLRSFMRETAAALDPPTRRILRTLAAGAAADTAAADQVREQFLVRRRAALAAILQAARDRGQLPAEPAVETLLDLAFGSLWYRLIFAIGPLDQDWADAVTSAITALAR